MRVRVYPHPLSGAVTAPPSKSAAHRAVICALLSENPCTVTGACLSDDIAASLDAARALGAQVNSTQDGSLLRFGGSTAAGNTPVTVDCGESGSTQRFFVPIVCAMGRPATFLGRGKLPQRPIGPLAMEMERHGALFSRLDGMPFTVSGRLTPGTYALPGNISSQYITGLLFALPLLDGHSDIVLTTPLESAAYVDMTLEVLRESGVVIEPTHSGWHVPGPQRYGAGTLQVEGDYSGAAFWLCAGALGSSLQVCGLRPDSVQGDRAITAVLQRMGADVQGRENLALRGGDLRGVTVDASSIPDLVPVLAAAASWAKGTTVFQNASRLRIKECDRLAAMADCITRLGGSARENGDSLVIRGGAPLAGGRVSGWGDHRMVMAMAVAAAHCTGPVEISDAQAVSKSYPGFWDEFRRLGGVYDVL